MHAARRVDQLGGDAHPPARAPNAALENVARAEILGEFRQADRLELEGGRARDDLQLAEARQVGDDVLGEAVGEILVDLGAQIVEGQYRQHRAPGLRPLRGVVVGAGLIGRRRGGRSATI